MSMVDKLIETLGRAGLSITAGEKPGELLLRGPASAKTPLVLETVKAYKPMLLQKFGCQVRVDEPSGYKEESEPSPSEGERGARCA